MTTAEALEAFRCGDGVQAAIDYAIDGATEQSDATLLFWSYVEYLHSRNHDWSQAHAIDVAKSNLGYLAGYRDHETRRRVEHLYKCVHPTLGPAQAEPPTPAECMARGTAWGRDELTVADQPPELPLLDFP